MGCGSSKTNPTTSSLEQRPLSTSKNNAVNQVVPQSSAPLVVEAQTTNQNSSTNGEQVHMNDNQRSAPGRQVSDGERPFSGGRRSAEDRTSPPLKLTSSPNHNQGYDPARKISSRASTKNDDDDRQAVLLVTTKVPKRSSRSSTSSSAQSARSKTISAASLSSAGSHSHTHGSRPTLLPGPVGRCTHCPHCRRKGTENPPTPIPKWLSEHPDSTACHIDMDRFDNDAVKQKIVNNSGHIPGAYDYRPHLIIEDIDDYLLNKNNYVTLPVIAKTKPVVTPTHTPYPDYALLQSREQRLNKPFTLPLFTKE